MCQVYRSNASTNQYVREIIQKSDLANIELAVKFNHIAPSPSKE